ncbi:MAG: hypothetical protein GVY16_00940 [Planctomycetes bacterium]|jgi:hypothetical protein|nr:hypothetical protein [Phycisphaerae bacterium]NBB94291.1 hypothetical protein [Planctomycetota bacterium]
MKAFSPMLLVALAASCLMLGGCKQAQTRMVNTTSEELEVQIHGPGLNVGYVGTVPPRGELTTLIKVSPVWLPSTYTWTAGKHSGAFTITSDSAAMITVAIPQDAEAPLAPWRHAQGEDLLGSPAPVVYGR